MPSKPDILLPAALLVGIAMLLTWKISINEQARPDAPVRRSATRPGKHADHPDFQGQRPNFSAEPESLSNDDLLSIYHRDGAAAALAAAKAQSWPNRDNHVYFILTLLATKDPEFVATEVKRSGLNTFYNGSLVDTILKNWEDGQKALDWAENQLTGELRCKAIAGALGILGKSEPDAAFGYLESISAIDIRNQTICDLFSAWGSFDPVSALASAKDLSAGERKSAVFNLVIGWATTDPESAAAWVLETAPTDGASIARVYQGWIAKSPEQAQQWFDSLPEGAAKKTAYHLINGASGTINVGIYLPFYDLTDQQWSTKPVLERSIMDLRNWAIQNTKEAQTFVERNWDNPMSKQLAAQVAWTMSGKFGPSEALDWALLLPTDRGSREWVVKTVFDEWTEIDPAAAARKLASMPPEHTRKLPISLVNNWLKQDPAAAADWASQWKSGNETSLIESIIDDWPDQAPDAAYQWLGSLPAGAGRDAGIRTTIRRERSSAPESILPWIELISDPHTREKERAELNELLRSNHDE